jgi:hypothetical protein
MAPSRTVIAHCALSGQMSSKARTALTVTRIYKRAMKKININCKMWNKHFCIVIYHSSLVKTAMNAALVVNWAMVLKKPSSFEA